MVSDQRPDAAIRLSGSDATFILDEPFEPQHTLKIAVFDEQSGKAFRFERISEALKPPPSANALHRAVRLSPLADSIDS